MRDLLNHICFICKIGIFVETSINDDRDGVVHCSNCNHKTRRYIRDE